MGCVALQKERELLLTLPDLLHPRPRICLRGEAEFHSCYQGWSAMVQSRLTATSASWVQAILPPQPPV